MRRPASVGAQLRVREGSEADGGNVTGSSWKRARFGVVSLELSRTR